MLRMDWGTRGHEQVLADMRLAGEQVVAEAARWSAHPTRRGPMTNRPVSLRAMASETATRNNRPARKRGSYAPDVTRQTLLDVALQLFSERGFHTTTVQSIAQRAGVTKGAFYHHFESKEDVLRQIHAEYAGEMVLGAREIAARTDLRPAQQLRALIERAVISLGRHRQHVAVFYQENRFLHGEQYAAIREMHDEEEAILLDVIARGQATGEVRPDVDPKLLIFAISGMTAWIYQWYQESGPMTLEQIAVRLADVILEPVAVAPARRATNSKRTAGGRLAQTATRSARAR